MNQKEALEIASLLSLENPTEFSNSIHDLHHQIPSPLTDPGYNQNSFLKNSPNLCSIEYLNNFKNSSDYYFGLLFLLKSFLNDHQGLTLERGWL